MRTWLKWIIFLAVLGATPYVVQVTLLRPDPVAVQVQTVARGPVEETVSNSRAGTLRARRDARLSMETAGRVVTIHHREGAVVRRGDVLVTLDTTEARAALELSEREQATVLALLDEAKAVQELARLELKRNQELLAGEAVSAERVDQLRSQVDATTAQLAAASARVAQQQAAAALARTHVEMGTLTAPFDGVIAERWIEIGEWAMPGQTVLRLVDLNSLYVHAEIDEVDLSRVATNLPVRVSLDPLRGQSFRGRVVRVAPHVSDREKQNRTVEVEVDFEETPPAAVLKPGISADVELILDRVEDVLRIPAFALIEDRYVLVSNDSHAVRRDVETGLRNWDFVEIRSGLSAGDQLIVTLDRAEVREGAEVKAEEAP